MLLRELNIRKFSSGYNNVYTGCQKAVVRSGAGQEGGT